MAVWMFIAPRNLSANILKGFRMQVMTTSTGTPSSRDVEAALKRYGITDPQSLGYASSGNWDITKIS